MTDKEAIRESAQFYFDLLMKRFEASHPEGGEETEYEKLETARQAIELSWRLRDCIAVWAQAQIAGYLICDDMPDFVKFLKNKTGEDITPDSHILEAVGMQWSPNDSERIDRAFPEMSDWMEEWQEATGEGFISHEIQRRLIVEMMMSRTVNSSYWRMELQSALSALNVGEILPLFKKAGLKKQGLAFRIRECRALAVMHVYFRVGKGMKKYRALEEVGNSLGASPETIRTWEKSFKRDEDAQVNFYCAALAGEFHEEMAAYEKTRILDIKLESDGMHRGVWHLENAHYFYRNYASKPLDELRVMLREYRDK